MGKGRGEAAPLDEVGAPRYRWVVVGTMLTTYLGAYLVAYSLGILLPGISKELDLSPSQQGWLGTSTVLGSAVLALPIAWWLSRYRVKILGTAIMFLGTLFVFGQAWAPNFALFLLARLLFGFTLVARDTFRVIVTRQWALPKEITMVNALFNGITEVGVFIAVAVTPLILSIFSGDWRKVLFVYGAVSLLVALGWLALGKERIAAEYRTKTLSQTRSPIYSILRYRILWIIGLGLFGAEMSYTALLTFWPTYMLDKFNQSLQVSGLIFGVLPIASTLAGFGVAFIPAGVAVRRGLLVIAGLMMVVGCWGMLATGSIPLLVLFAALNGIAWGYWPVIATIPFELPEIKPRELPVVATFLETAWWGGFAVGPVLSGVLHQASGSMGLALFIVTSFALANVFSGTFLGSRFAQQPESAEETLS